MAFSLRLWLARLERAPERAAHGTVAIGSRLLVELLDEEGNRGLGELAALPDPTYGPETQLTEELALRAHLLPRIAAPEPEAIEAALASIRGHRAARAALSEAAWDLEARRSGAPLWRHLGGRADPVPAGVAIGLETPEQTLITVQSALATGYHRVKVKVSPPLDLSLLEELRRLVPPRVELCADANGSFADPEDPGLRALDALGFDLIEQPVDPDNLATCADATRRLATPVCLDEAIQDPGDLSTLLALGARPVVNLKLARVGGWSPARAILTMARAEGLDVLVGGMYETAIGRAHAIALATLPGVNRPGDLSPSSRYGTLEPTTPLELGADGYFALWRTPGIGRDIAGATLLWESPLAPGSDAGSSSTSSPRR